MISFFMKENSKSLKNNEILIKNKEEVKMHGEEEEDNDFMDDDYYGDSYGDETDDFLQ